MNDGETKQVITVSWGKSDVTFYNLSYQINYITNLKITSVWFFFVCGIPFKMQLNNNYMLWHKNEISSKSICM
jgi:hypothetical protein